MSKKALPIVIILLVIAAFLAGSFYTRTTQKDQSQKDTQSEGQAAGVQTEAGKEKDPLSPDNLTAYAKKVNLDLGKFEKCLKDNTYGQRLTDDTNYATTVGINGSPNFYINGKYLAGAFPYELFKEIVDKEINGTASDNIKDYSQELQDAASQKYFDLNPDKVPEIKEDAPVKGPNSAPVVIIEFTDPSCPYCTRAYLTLKKLFSEYGDKIQLVFYYFPGHGTGEEATKAMFCAGEQNKFWQFYDQVFDANAVSYGL